MIENNDGNDTTNSEVVNDPKVNPGQIRKATTNNILNALSNASGEQFDSVESALAFIARTTASMQASQNSNVGNAQPVEQDEPKGKRITTNDLHDQFSKLQQQLAEKDQRLREKELDASIMQAMGDKFDPDLMDYALSKVKQNIQFDTDGTFAIVDARGRERYGSDGSPLSLSGLVDEVAKTNPKLLKQNITNTGSGLKPMGGNFAGASSEVVPDYSQDPAAFNAWANANGLGKNMGLKGMKVSATSSTQNRTIL